MIITKDERGGFEIVTARGKEIYVYVHEFGCVVYVPQNGRRLAMGRTFRGVEEAAVAYKKADIRDALLMLADELAA